MRKRVYILIAFMVIIIFGLQPQTVFATDPTGNPITDAPTLKADIDAFAAANNDAGRQQASTAILTFFSAYFPSGAAPQNPQALRAAIVDNPYLMNELNAYFNANVAPAEVTAAFVGSSTGQKQSGNLFTGANLEDVLATFIANRFKQELEIAFLDKMKTWLDNNTTFKTFLPNTWLVLDQNEPFNYSTFFESLKEALEKDIRSLPVDVGTYLGNDPFRLAKATNQYNNILVLYETIVQIAQGQNAFLMFAAINKNPLIDAVAEPVGNGALRLAGILARILINPPISPISTTLIPVQDIKNDLSTSDERTIFIGLLMLSEKGELQKIRFGAQDLYTTINGINGDVGQVAAFIQWFNGAVAAYQSATATVNQIIQLQKGFKNITGQLVANLLTSTKSILTSIQSFPLAPAGFFPAATYQAIDGQLTDLSKIATDMSDSNYGMAFSDLVSYIKTDIRPVLDANAQATLDKLLPIFQQYGGFAVSVAKAKSNQDLEQALEAAALPVGSYRIKRTSYKNISLNAWAGGFVGEQHYPGTVPTSVNKDNVAYGFTVPIGIAYSWGAIAGKDNTGLKFKKGDLNGVSNTIFLSILDVGALTAFRLTQDSTATLPDFKWQNVLAPGLFYVVGFRKSPLSLGVGAQYGPQLRSITNDAAVTLPSAITFRLFVGVDIPLFNFFTRTTEK
jgi:hypothetical protein